MSISSTGLYGSATIVNSDLFNPLFPQSSIVCTVQSFFASQTLHNRKILKKKSGDVNDEANFSLFILLHKRAKPYTPPLPSPSPPRTNSNLYSPLYIHP